MLKSAFTEFKSFQLVTGVALAAGIALLGVPRSAQALSYGIYEPRGLAMGGTGVAVASFHQAQYYNPALLALNDESENTSRDSRFVFPNIVLQIDDAAQDIVDAADDNLQENLELAVQAYNANPSQTTAGDVATRARDLQRLLLDLGNKQVDGELVAGLSVSVPSLLEGGAFFLNSRSISVADSSIPAADFALLESYISALETVASGGDLSTIPPELLDANGNLIDPTDSFNSSAQITAYSIFEWGVSLSKQFDFFGQGLAVGVTPKVLRVLAINDSTDFGDDELEFDSDEQSYLSMNADLGVAFQLFENYRIALAAKDLIPEKFTTSSGAELQIKPRMRMGLAYVHDYVSVGLDYDLGENEPTAFEAATQDASFGLEISPWSFLDLQLGYRQDLTGFREDTMSGGVAFRLKRFAVELSYAKSDTVTSGGLQFGWIF
ncbi:F plasmid transfer operon protein TraF [Alteromonadaceae bacterium 2753L.S.0a.02]|nr:F plasmid transfer operon protein TraF [Alteromonadaceae bacterium 2753L.S.0a.02]